MKLKATIDNIAAANDDGLVRDRGGTFDINNRGMTKDEVGRFRRAGIDRDEDRRSDRGGGKAQVVFHRVGMSQRWRLPAPAKLPETGV